MRDVRKRDSRTVAKLCLFKSTWSRAAVPPPAPTAHLPARQGGYPVSVTAASPPWQR